MSWQQSGVAKKTDVVIAHPENGAWQVILHGSQVLGAATNASSVTMNAMMPEAARSSCTGLSSCTEELEAVEDETLSGVSRFLS